MNAVGEQVQFFELILVLHHIGNGNETTALGAAIGRLGTGEEVLQVEMRIVLVEDILTPFRHPQHTA